MKKLTVFLTFALLLIAEAYAQSPRTVTGKVTDDKGTPLSGVTISAVGMNKNALSENNGTFSIQVSEKVKSLKITYVGFDSKEVSISGVSTVTVSLSPEDKALNEGSSSRIWYAKRKEISQEVSLVLKVKL